MQTGYCQIMVALYLYTKTIPSSPTVVSERGFADNCELRGSSIQGHGVFAKRALKQGEQIAMLTGQRKSLPDVFKMIKNRVLQDDDPLQIDMGQYMLLDPESRAFNHSCKPNAGIKGKSELFALRDIPPGEEITYDYSTTGGVNITPDRWTMHGCNCGSEHCRHDIGNVLTIPPNTLEQYLQAGALPDFNIPVAQAAVAGNRDSIATQSLYTTEDFLRRIFLQIQSPTDAHSVEVITRIVEDWEMNRKAV